ncbi:hypothetical protein [Zavarzinia sp. CC-PAN008]|uniref:hypothetical protein n=1 Tax=Zavarzinia sp. CC-PAN008 TaxID=3243332 RepID=UPI003F7476C3
MVDAMSFIPSLKRWLGGRDSGPADTQAGPAGSAPGGGPTPDADLLAQQLRTLFRQRQSLVAGAVHLIGLASLRARTGDRWPKVADRVHLLVQQALQRHLGPQDVFFRYGDETYVVAFASLAKEPAQLLCAKVVSELQRALFGEADMASIQITSAVVEENGQIGFEDVQMVDLLNAAVRSATGTEAAPRAGPAPPPEPAAPQLPIPGLAAPETPPPPAGPSRFAEREVTWASIVPEGEPEFRFRPVLDLGRGLMSAWIVQPERRLSHGLIQHDYDVLADPLDANEIGDLDCGSLIAGVTALDDAFRRHAPVGITVPVHFETLASVARRRRYVDIARRIPSHLQKGLMFCLTNLPEGVPYVRLAEITVVLRPFARSILAVTGWRRTDIAIFAQAGIPIVGATAEPQRADDDILDDVRRLTAMVDRIGGQAFIDGVTSWRLLAALCDTPVRFVMGSRLGPSVAQPERVRRLGRQDIAAAAGTSIIA